MRLLRQVSFNRIKEELAQFHSNDQPSTLTSPNSLEKQISGVRIGVSDQTKKEIENYRAYKAKRDKKNKANEKKKSHIEPLLPNSLKKEIKRSKIIKSDDIAPTI